MNTIPSPEFLRAVDLYKKRQAIENPPSDDPRRKVRLNLQPLIDEFTKKNECMIRCAKLLGFSVPRFEDRGGYCKYHGQYGKILCGAGWDGKYGDHVYVRFNGMPSIAYVSCPIEYLEPLEAFA